MPENNLRFLAELPLPAVRIAFNTFSEIISMDKMPAEFAGFQTEKIPEATRGPTSPERG